MPRGINGFIAGAVDLAQAKFVFTENWRFINHPKKRRKPMRSKRIISYFCIVLGLFLINGPAFGKGQYGPGASDTEIKIGHTTAYSGPGSAYGTIGKAEAAYFKMINDKGGINGRKITFISYDDAYSPPKSVEQVRRLVENDQVLLLFQLLGTASNTANWDYLNKKKVPQLFVGSGATKWGDPKGHPWTMGWQPNYQSEGRIYAKYILEHLPKAKIGILYQNDDYGKDLLKGLMDGLGNKASSLIVSEQSYELSDPTVDSQIVNLKNSGADVFVNISTPKFAAQAIRKVNEIGWKPFQFLNYVSNSVGAVLKPAGLEASKGVLSLFYLKDPDDPEYQNDPATKEWLAWMKKYYPDGNVHDVFNVFGYSQAQTMVQVLKQCGDDLTRENVMRQAANLKNLALPMLLPGIKINTSPTDFFPVEQMQFGRFDGQRWVLFGKLIEAPVR
jgi:branched-chain amino acid transport system substrate-binding protein